MVKLFPIFKDLTISAIIAVLTANLISLPNLIYQIIIAFLILLLIFFILRGLDNRAKRLEILSVMYVEVFVRPFLTSVKSNAGLEINGSPIGKLRLYIILPENEQELRKVQDTIRGLERFTLNNTGNRAWHINGKLIDDILLVFDTPISWINAIDLLIASGKLKPSYLTGLLGKMNQDIKLYYGKHLAMEEGNLQFMKVAEFEKFFK